MGSEEKSPTGQTGTLRPRSREARLCHQLGSGGSSQGASFLRAARGAGWLPCSRVKVSINVDQQTSANLGTIKGHVQGMSVMRKSCTGCGWEGGMHTGKGALHRSWGALNGALSGAQSVRGPQGLGWGAAGKTGVPVWAELQCPEVETPEAPAWLARLLPGHSVRAPRASGAGPLPLPSQSRVLPCAGGLFHYLSTDGTPRPGAEPQKVPEPGMPLPVSPHHHLVGSQAELARIPWRGQVAG